MKFKITFFLLLTVFLNLDTIAQSGKKIKISIKVRDSKNKPIPGAVILFDDVRQKRWTNSKGVFKTIVDNPPKEISAFSPKIGLKKVKFKGEKNILIIIREKNDAYVETSSLNKTSSTIQYKDIYDYLRGQVPGVNITGYNTINIRGYNSVNGSTTPLFIINNTAVNQEVFDNIVPTTIKSVRVLKGPESASFGSRGANGVIIVETH